MPSMEYRGPNSAEDLSSDPACPQCGAEVPEGLANFASENGTPLHCERCKIDFAVERHVMYYTAAVDG